MFEMQPRRNLLLSPPLSSLPCLAHFTFDFSAFLRTHTTTRTTCTARAISLPWAPGHLALAKEVHVFLARASCCFSPHSRYILITNPHLNSIYLSIQPFPTTLQHYLLTEPTEPGRLNTWLSPDDHQVVVNRRPARAAHPRSSFHLFRFKHLQSTQLLP
ncbi:hypothetical protein F5B22DRAFT_152493 [Xylaria bambusicola]|uniref:uncharacterized protein n=1 Tax=Xylaria bambusicola TaxID=326684 RepID=UPI002008B544|nr:uncharacterized protein F5B22DRAFT_152493 [Xylaria bambusicola]KAI0526307.1 hypothetical protein F5B22DRAFT_152493 [Xylaria bambusicola]